MSVTRPCNILKASEQFLAAITRAVSGFPRRYRYTLGTKLEDNAMEITRQAQKAWRDRTLSLEPLSDAMDDMKTRLQLAQDVGAWASFNQFEALAKVLYDLGRQCGGWRKQRSSVKGQNAPSSSATAQRPSILSSRAASAEAKP